MHLTKMPVKQTFTHVGRELSYVGYYSFGTTRTARNEGFGSLKPVGQHVLEIPTDEQVDLILESATDAHRLTFALMSDAGLRPNEVRALRCKNVQLKWENGEAIGGFITIREGRSYGEIHTPKTGQREIPISRALAKLLAPVIACRSRDQHVALSDRGKPWSQWGIDSAFGRVSQRAGVEGWSVYCLRHYAITSWLRAGIPVHVVQRMAGHSNLSTTQRYVHFLKGDLEEAARRLPVRQSVRTAQNEGFGAQGAAGDPKPQMFNEVVD